MIVELLRGRDLSTPATNENAYQAVVAAYVQRFGGRHVLASENESETSNLTPWIVLGGLLGLSTAAFVLLERQRSRLRPKRRRR